jgi:hypothetical protein
MSYELDVSRQRREGGISVISFNPVNGPNTLRGFADLHIVGWHFRILGCPCHAGYDRRWVGLPGKPMTDREGIPMRDESTGKIRYVSFAAFDDKDLLRRFSDAACAALDVYAPGWDRP